jgi:hypothetical protein
MVRPQAVRSSSSDGLERRSSGSPTTLRWFSSTAGWPGHPATG